MASWITDQEQILSTFKLTDNAIKITTKDGWFWQMLASVLAFLHLMDRTTFLNQYSTTIGAIQAYPSWWSTEQVLEIGSHECKHVRQARWFGLGLSPWLGLPIMSLCYLALPLPIFGAWIRYRLELAADTGYWNYLLHSGYGPEHIANRAEWFAKTISSSKYGWSIPRAWALWGFNRKVRRLYGVGFEGKV
jgi:hypothetical protein